MSNDKLSSIILAAGRNERLKGVVPAYYKPLLVVDGSPLILTHVKNCLEFKIRPVIVAAPENVKMICDVLDELVHEVCIAIQPKATGPVDAVRIGHYVNTLAKRKMIICADNVIKRDIFESVAWQNTKPQLFYGKYLPHEEAKRFTRYSDRDGVFYEGEYQQCETYDDILEIKCWIGPLVLTNESIDIITKESQPKLGPLLNKVGDISFMEAQCEDIGVPEAINS